MFFKNYTRGGQIAVHSLRMFTQIFRVTLGVSIFVFVLTAGYFLVQSTNKQDLELLFEYSKNQLRESLPKDKPPITIVVNNKKLSGKWSELRENRAVKQKIDSTISSLIVSLFKGLWASLISISLILGFFVWRGLKHKQGLFVRGGKIVSSKKLWRIMAKKKILSHFKIGGFPIVKDSETKHILITGTTGTGKTNALNSFLPQIRDQKVIIVDTHGDMVAKYYDETRDHILNLGDPRSVKWTPFSECQKTIETLLLADSLIPQQPHTSDKFWDDAARIIFKESLKLAGNSVAEIEKMLIKSPIKEYGGFFKNTEAAALTDPSGEKTTLSIRANLVSKLRWLPFMSNEGDFSIRKWVESGDGWLFISSSKLMMPVMKPLISTWFDIAINATLGLPIDEKRRLFYVLDELASLQKLSSLETGLAESRKFGGAFIVGTQNISQIYDIYGHQLAKSILDLFNTKYMFRSNDPDTTQWISKTLGEVEAEESSESLSYGANTMRDGVNLNFQKKVSPIVMPSEISNLPNLSCFVKFPGELPITQLKMRYFG